LARPFEFRSPTVASLFTLNRRRHRLRCPLVKAMLSCNSVLLILRHSMDFPLKIWLRLRNCCWPPRPSSFWSLDSPTIWAGDMDGNVVSLKVATCKPMASRGQRVPSALSTDWDGIEAGTVVSVKQFAGNPSRTEQTFEIISCSCCKHWRFSSRPGASLSS
jgi:hypothetical protein